VLAALKPGIDGEVFNVVDDELLTSREFLREYKQHVKNFKSVPLPYFLAYWLSGLWEDYSKRRKGQLPPAFNRRRCAADWKGNCYSNRKLRDRVGWQPRVSMKTALANFLSQFN
jgi:nucleoside-diphosphate-sugar epimerase